MKKIERLNRILSILDEAGVVHINDLVEQLDVSQMTIRRDLAELEHNNLLERYRGGAKSMDLLPTAEDDCLTSVPHALEKRQIALAGRDLLNDHEVIYIGAGTTTAFLARVMNQHQSTVVTNSYDVFKILNKTMPEKVILTGGLLEEKTGAFTGSITASVVKSMRFSTAYFSCSAIHNGDVMVSSIEQGEIDQIAFNNARRRILLTDHTKFGMEDFYVSGLLKDFDLVITDSEISDTVLQEYTKFASIQRCTPLPKFEKDFEAES